MNLLPVGNVFGECEAVGGCARPNWGNLIFGRRPLLPLFTHHLLRALTSKYRSNKGQNKGQNICKIKVKKGQNIGKKDRSKCWFKKVKHRKNCETALTRQRQALLQKRSKLSLSALSCIVL